MKLKTLAVLAAAAVALPVAASAETPAAKKDGRVDRIFSRLDLNKDGKITRAEMKQYREAQFKAADADGNGAINSVEMAAFVKARMAERLNARFTAGDKNKDGKITLDEMRGRKGRHGRFMFWRIDRDGDGAVTKAEMMRTAERWRRRGVAIRFWRLDDNRNGLISKAEFVEAPARLFRRFDANDDGVVTREEATAAMASFRGRHRGYRRGRGGWRHRDGWGGRGRHGMGMGGGRHGMGMGGGRHGMPMMGGGRQGMGMGGGRQGMGMGGGRHGMGMMGGGRQGMGMGGGRHGMGMGGGQSDK
jgi:Ca2+-binding EF-hand superfamily protein